LNGLQVQELIAAQTTIPVIFMTGRGDVPSAAWAMKAGAMDFLAKPIDETTLLAGIEKAFEQESRSLPCRYTGAISCGKWQPILLQLWLSSPAN